MRIDTGQHLRMDQRMKLAPRMIQSMEILQMAQAALEERIEQELVSNPTLEIQEITDAGESRGEEQRQAERDDRDMQRELVVTDDTAAPNAAADDFERLSNMQELYGESWAANTTEGFARRQLSRSAGERDRKLDAMANTASRGASLYEQLLDQWRLLEVGDELDEAGRYLLGQVDADGYLRTTLDELAAQAPDGVTRDALEEALEIIQYEIEPAGIGARDLRDCLLIQIDNAGRLDPDRVEPLRAPRTLVANHLKDIENNRLPKISRETGLDLDQIKAAITSLRQFQPHPGRALVDDTPQSITPDAIIDYDEDTDSYDVTLTSGRIPTLRVSPDYEDLFKDKQTEAETKRFVGTHLRNARWLIDAIEQRANTLLRVIGVVIQAQRGFFEEGEQALKPLPMTLVADQLGIHVATVSRAVADKYMQTPRGIYPLRMFFSGGTESAAGEAMSWTAVQAKLKEVIDAEDKAKPLSDDALVEEMKKQGIDIARRTIAKYRKQLNIPTARQRREY